MKRFIFSRKTKIMSIQLTHSHLAFKILVGLEIKQICSEIPIKVFSKLRISHSKSDQLLAYPMLLMFIERSFLVVRGRVQIEKIIPLFYSLKPRKIVKFKFESRNYSSFQQNLTKDPILPSQLNSWLITRQKVRQNSI